MKRPIRILALSCGCIGSLLAGEPLAKTPATAEPLPSIFAPRSPAGERKEGSAAPPRVSTPPRRRAISAELSAKLSEVANRTMPPASGPTETAVAAGDLADVVQLSPFIVREEKERTFKERDLLTAKGKIALARRRYPGIPPLTDAAALVWINDEFAAERRREIAELRGLLEIDAKIPPELKRRLNESAMNPSQFSPQIGERFREPR